MKNKMGLLVFLTLALSGCYFEPITKTTKTVDKKEAHYVIGVTDNNNNHWEFLVTKEEFEKQVIGDKYRE